MRAVPILMALVIAAVPLATGTLAQEVPADRVELSQPSAFIADRVQATFHVMVPAEATVEVTPGTPSWAGVELVSIGPPTFVPRGAQTEWVFEATLAPFIPGQLRFAPSVAIISGAEVTSRTLPPVPFTVVPTLGPDDPLVLTPLPPPLAIAGAESPFLRPALALGVVTVLVVLALLSWWLARRGLKRPGAAQAPAASPGRAPALVDAEAAIDADPVTAYRVMSSVVKSALARRHGLHATALTSTELRRRLEDQGVDRWHARLVGGLLEECDAVIYAGYRPALERRQADLNMAREIVEVGA